MLQFSVFYRLGLSLSYTYWHIPFHSFRSGPLQSTTPLGRISRNLQTLNARVQKWRSPDIYTFLGFNEHFRLSAPKPQEELDEVEVGISDSVLRQHNIRSVPELQAFIRECVAARPGAADTAALVKFRLSLAPGPDITHPRRSRAGRRFFDMIHEGIPDYPDSLDLRRVYFEARRKRPWASEFPKGKVRTVVHIRQGDTAVLRTPWDTYVPLRGSRSAFVEHVRFRDIPGRLMQVSDFRDFVSGLCSHFDKQTFSTLFFSDGFERAFQKLGDQLNRLQLAPNQTRALQKSGRSYDRREFAPLRSIPNSRAIIGENARQLCSLVHAALAADIVIIGPQQRMLPKLLANYCCNENMPLIIALDRGDEDAGLEHAHRFLGSQTKRNSMCVNVDNPDYEHIADRLAAAVPQLRPLRKRATL